MLLERTNSVDVLVQLTRDSRVALHRQIEASIRDAIRAGRLARGASLPPTRVLAADLGVSRGVVVEAYQQLVAEGYLTSRSGSFTRVAAGAEHAERSAPPSPPQAPRFDLSPCRADVSHFPRGAWLRSVRQVLREIPDEQLGSVGGRGAPALHHALAEYLNRVRGTSARPDDIVVCNGYAQGIALVIDVMVRSGARRLAVEDPCADDDAVPVARAAGLEVVGVPVGDDGVRVDALDRLEADALVLTPSHQWPTGAVLSADARAAVLRWARERGALIVEDDYDAEYRYDRAPIGAMQGLAPDRVIYAGTASKTLAPGLRLGWLVPPADLVGPIATRRRSPIEAHPFSTSWPSPTSSLAASSTATCAGCARSTAAAATRSSARCECGYRSSSRPASPPACISSPICLVDVDEAAVVAAAADRGVAVDGLAPYRISRGGRPGLILGYAALDERALTEAVALIAEAVGDVRATPSWPPSSRERRSRRTAAG